MGFSTVTFQQNAINQIEALDSAISQSQNQLSTGSKLPNAAADPVGMTQVNQYNAQVSASQQYVNNGNATSSNLNLEESALTSVTNVLQSARDLALQANNSAMSSAQRQDIATQLTQQMSQLMSVANGTDANGHYLFSGTATGTQPFAQTGSAVSYNGSTSVNQVEISPNQFVSQGDAGNSVFMNIPAGNGTFTTAASATNTGDASIGTGSVTSPNAWVPDTYTIEFSSTSQYQVTNSTGGVIASGTYTNGGTIAFNGIQVALSGTPQQGDRFTVAPAGKASMFSTLSNLVSTLNSSSLSFPQIATRIGQAVQQLDNSMNHIDSVQASVGARLNAVTASQSSAQTTQTALQTSISQLSNTDYAAATTQLSTEELALQAAEKSYASIAKLSLFNYV